MTKRVAILLFPGFDLIDAGGPYEVFLTASRLAERDGRPPQYEVVLVSPAGADAVRSLVGSSPVIASVCTGAFFLADAGVLSGKSATTHWEDLEALEDTAQTGAVKRGVRWVDEGSVVTSGGLTSGIHMALHLVARDYGVDHAVRTAKQLDQPWDPSGATA